MELVNGDQSTSQFDGAMGALVQFDLTAGCSASLSIMVQWRRKQIPPSVVTPSGITISLQWAWEDLNFQHTAHFNRAVLSRAPRKLGDAVRPHAYQAFEFRPTSRHCAVIFTMDHVICRHLETKCRPLPGSIDTITDIMPRVGLAAPPYPSTPARSAASLHAPPPSVAASTRIRRWPLCCSSTRRSRS